MNLLRSLFVAATLFCFTACVPEVSQYRSAQKATVILETERAFGTGVVIRRINPNGKDRLFAWTAAHVVRDCDTLTVHVTTRSGPVRIGYHSYQATVVTRDNDCDLALIEFTAPPEFFGWALFESDFSFEPVGTQVFHVGNFHGKALEGSVTSGIVSQTGVSFPSLGWTLVDTTSTPTQHGGSGGGVFDVSDGKLVGIMVGMSDYGVYFFVPLRMIKTFAVQHAVSFAVYGVRCPSDADLFAMESAAAQDRLSQLTDEP